MKWGRQAFRTALSFVVHNATLKIFSLAFACGLWLFVNAGERDTEKTLLVPVELRNLPPQLVVVGPRVDYVDLRVSGPRTLLGRLSSKRITLDLAGVRPGPSSFRITTDLLNLPRGVKVVRITPSQVNLEIARLIKRTIPVSLDLVGKPPHGYSVVETEVIPAVVEVTGPAPEIGRLETIPTDPLDLGAATHPITQELNLRGPQADFVSYSAEKVQARVEIQEVILTREFRRLRVEVKNAAFRAIAAPPLVDVTVRGPQRLVEKLKLNSGAVFVDAANLGPGTVTLPVTVDLPPGLEVIAQEPGEVELRLIEERKPQTKGAKEEVPTGASP
ncbi:MAG: CdaR family protein [Candidatus Binatia bacterium]|nr:CdaR family protein [Candidatus Binatia bacterium]